MNLCLIQNFNRVGDLYEMIQSNKKLKAVEIHQKKFQNSKKLGLDPYVVTCDEQDIISALQVTFDREIILAQHCIKKKRLDAYFSKYKLGIEVDEYNHKGRNFEYKLSGQFMIVNHGITIIRTNSGAADFEMNRLIKEIYMHIIKSTN